MRSSAPRSTVCLPTQHVKSVNAARCVCFRGTLRRSKKHVDFCPEAPLSCPLSPLLRKSSFRKPLTITALQKSQKSAQAAPRTERTSFFVRQKSNLGKILDIFLYFKRKDRTLFSFSRIREGGFYTDYWQDNTEMCGKSCFIINIIIIFAMK